LVEPKVEHWSLDKRVPIALIFAIALQTTGVVWYVATLTSRIGVNEVNISRVERDVLATRVSAQNQAVQLGRIEEQITGLREDIRGLLRQLEQQQRRP
jgi:Tfp pilus assembly protein PilO